MRMRLQLCQEVFVPVPQAVIEVNACFAHFRKVVIDFFVIRIHLLPQLFFYLLRRPGLLYRNYLPQN